MRPDFIQLLRCPARDCDSGGLAVEVSVVERVPYRTGTVEEVREGAIACPSCGRSYPIQDFVPSFEQLFPPELQEEAQYWSDWYGFFWDRGYKGLFDLRAPFPIFIARGIEVPDPNSLSGQDLPGTHTILADHPLVRQAERLLDVGCGCGWSSLYLARRGHQVVAFDPSAGNVRRAKLYAVSQGEYIEYLATGLGFLSFEPGVFDGVFALHSIHHVPDLRNETVILKSWLREGGVLAMDEHIQSDPTLGAILPEIEKWFQEEVAPKYVTLSLEELSTLPTAGHSKMEDAGSAEVLDAIEDNFSMEGFRGRFVSLDNFSFMYYLSQDCDTKAYLHASQVVDKLYRFLQGASPERLEYATVLARKLDEPGPANEELHRIRDLIAARDRQARLLAKLPHAEKLNETLEAKNSHILDLQATIARLEGEIANKQAALDRQADLLRRIEAGRVMRLVNRITSFGRRTTGNRGEG